MSKNGNILGAMLLIGGSCIGAGMLALPIATGLCGFYPSLFAFFGIWAFMTLTALLLVEITAWFPRKANLITMVEHTLGKPGKAACWILYLFLFYSVLLAYIAGIGSLTSTLFSQYLQISLSPWIADLFFVAIFGCIIYLGTRPVDLFNRFLMVGKIAIFIALIFVGVQYIKPQLLHYSSPNLALFSLPILVIAFGFHNMIPSLSDYLQNNSKKMRTAILLGGLFTLTIYLIWQLTVLGIVPVEGKDGIIDNFQKGREASQALIGILGSSSISYLATFLAFFAILTSFLAQSLSLSHFLADGLKIRYQKHEEISMILLTLIPPLLLAILYPNIFLKALNFAGGICAVILFGVLPVLMVWKGRYQKHLSSSYQVFGGKPLLVVLFAVALFIAFFQVSSMFNASYLPKIIQKGHSL